MAGWRCDQAWTSSLHAQGFYVDLPAARVVRREANGGAGRVMRSVHGASRSSWVTAASGASGCSTRPAQGWTEPPAWCLAGGDARSEASCKASVCFTWDF